MPWAFFLALAALAPGSADHGHRSILTGTRATPRLETRWIDPVLDYPARARRAGESGTVVARLFVNGAGRATSCLVLQSPPAPALGAGTCRILLRRARFMPFEGGGLATHDYRIVWDAGRLPPVPRPSEHYVY